MLLGRKIIDNFFGWALLKYTFKPLFLRCVAVPTLRLLILVLPRKEKPLYINPEVNMAVDVAWT